MVHLFRTAVLISIAVIFALPLRAATYYVDSQNGSDSRAGTSDALSWQSLTKVNGTSFAAGDTIKFKCGGSWTGQLGLDNSGSSGHPVVYTSYGSGAKPLIGNSGGDIVNVSADYVILDGLMLDGLNMNVIMNNGINTTTGSSYGIFRNLEITRVGEGVTFGGDHHLITHCYIHDLHMSHADGGGDDDCGARAVNFCNGSTIEVSYNRIENCTQPSPDYGTDGGAFEGWLAFSDVKIHHNYVYRANGILECGGTGGQTVTNVALYYNIFVENVGAWLAIHTGDIFSINPSNITVDNNTFVSSGSTWNAGNWLTMRNNVFYSSSGGGNQSNNYSGDPFVDRAAGNYHLKAGSSCINAGQNLGYTVDYDGNPVPAGSAPDIGAFEYGSASGIINIATEQEFHAGMNISVLGNLVNIYPNTKNYSLQIFDISGRKVFQHAAGNDEKPVLWKQSVRSPDGIYFAVLNTPGKQMDKQKIVVVR